VRVTSALPPLLLLLPLALLAACGDDATPTDAGRSATGEVLEGTISDDMLPLATVRSQPPLLPPEEQDEGDDEPAAPGAEPTPAAPVEEGAAPAPPPVFVEPPAPPAP